MHCADFRYELRRRFLLLVDNYEKLRSWRDVEKFYEKILPENICYCYDFDKCFSKARMLREWYEAATLMYAVGLIEGSNPWSAFNKLVNLYEKQIKLRRTSQNQILEQFSTPLPVSYVLGLWAAMNVEPFKQPVAVDPTAGNGLLLFYFIQKNRNNDFSVYLNDLDILRNFISRQVLNVWNKYTPSSGMFNITNKDFYEFVSGFNRSADYLLINPPFSRTNKKVSVTENGKTYSFRSQDFAMVTTALNKLLADNGRAACIIGGHRFGEVEQSTYWDKKGRPKAGEERDFWFFLFENYNVVDVMYIDGKRLWAKQGQETNLRVILIDGRKKIQGIAQPPLYNPNWDRLITQWSELWDRVGRTKRNLFQLTREKLKNNG